MNILSKLSFLAMTLLTACSFDGMYLHPTKLPSNTRRMNLSSESDTTVVLFDSVTYQPTFLKNGKDTMDFDFTIESVVFKSSNGNLLNGWMMKPRKKEAKISLLHFHGNAGFLITHYQAMAPLMKFGYQIFLFDYSGFGFSEGEATRQNIRMDGNSALDYVKSRSDVSSTQLVLYGQSLGGHLAAVVAEQRQADIDALVIEGAFSSHKDIAAETSGIFGRMLVSEKYSAYKSIHTYKKPVLVIHSSEDEVIPFEMGQKLFENANAPNDFYEIKNCHICGPRYYADSISQKIIRMLR